jgi:hypothetical protein
MGSCHLGEIQHALWGYERQVDLHRQKLKSPEQFVENWAKKSPHTQEGLLWHWQEDLARNQELVEIMRGILQDRGIQP